MLTGIISKDNITTPKVLSPQQSVQLSTSVTPSATSTSSSSLTANKKQPGIPGVSGTGDDTNSDDESDSEKLKTKLMEGLSQKNKIKNEKDVKIESNAITL